MLMFVIKGNLCFFPLTLTHDYNYLANKTADGLLRLRASLVH